MKTTIFAAAFAALSLAGCAATAPLETASGRPEATIAADKATVKAELLNRAVTNRWQITRETESMVTVQKANPDMLTNFLLGSTWDPTTELRINYTLISSGSNTRILADASIVTNEGTAFEQVTAVTNNKSNEAIRLELENLKTYVEYHGKKTS